MMCGIVAVRGRSAVSDVLTRLKGLEYRGYDSAGVAELCTDRTVHVSRSVGPVDALIDRLTHDDAQVPAGRIAIGHTRWSTHGAASVRNAHPLSDCEHEVTVVHNGVLENATDLRIELEAAGHRFESDVDSEVIPHLIEMCLGGGASPFDAFQKAIRRLRGSWAIAALIARSNAIYVARHRSPLVVRGTVGRFVAASDVTATVDVRGPLRVFDDGTIAELGTTWHWAGTAARGPAPVVLREREVSERRPDDVLAAGIRKQPSSTTAMDIGEQRNLVARLVGEIVQDAASTRRDMFPGSTAPTRVLLLGCGTSHHAAQVTARVLRLVAQIDACATVASEFEPALTSPFDVAVAISRSGETADLLAALDGVATPIIAITNSIQSSLARRADTVVDCGAGVERGVAATKAFTSQVLCGIRVALATARAAGQTSRIRTATSLLATLPDDFSAAIDRGSPIGDEDALVFGQAPGWLFLGTGAGLPYASEGALKLKELSHRWAESVPTAELKHGPLALVAAGTPVVLLDDGASRSRTARSELVARGAHVIEISPSRPRSTVEFGRGAPWGPLDAIPSLQYLALSIARALRRNIDRPRNLAKSVTVG